MMIKPMFWGEIGLLLSMQTLQSFVIISYEVVSFTIIGVTVKSLYVTNVCGHNFSFKHEVAIFFLNSIFSPYLKCAAGKHDHYLS